MVFFTSLLVVVILYYLQTEGLIFVTIIAVIGELINIFMTQTATKATEKKTAIKFSKVVQGYKVKIESQKKTIKELEEIQEESVRKVLTANKRTKTLEEQLGISQDEAGTDDTAPGKVKIPLAKNASKEKSKKYVDLPPGSNRKKLPI